MNSGKVNFQLLQGILQQLLHLEHATETSVYDADNSTRKMPP